MIGQLTNFPADITEITKTPKSSETKRVYLRFLDSGWGKFEEIIHPLKIFQN